MLPVKHKSGLQGKNSQKAFLQQLFSYPLLPGCGFAQLRGKVGSAGSAALPDCCISASKSRWDWDGVGGS